MSLFRTKTFEDMAASSMEAQESGTTMKRTLDAWSLTALGIGGIIGAGIFVLTGNAAATYAGPSIILSFVLSGIACVFTGLCYAEFACLMPLSGSAYTYAYATMGQFLAWIIGWDLILEYLFASSTVAVGWSGYVTNFMASNLHIQLPKQLVGAPIDYNNGWVLTGNWINLPAILIIGAITLLLVIGIKESSKFNGVVVLVKLIVIVLFILFGVSFIQTENLTPFIPENTGEFGKYGWSGILRGAGVIFFAYIGFDAVSTTAQEAKNPQRDMPIGIIGSLVVCTILYVLVALVLTGMVKYDQLLSPNPIAVAVDAAGEALTWLSPIIKLGAIAGLSSVILVMLMAQPRIFYAMSKDKLLPPLFSRIHPSFKTPHISSIITGVLASLLAGLFPINILGELVSIGTLLAFAIVCVGVMILRYKKPELHRPFKVPYLWLVGSLGAGFSILQMAGLPKETWFRLLLWMAIGLLIYFFYGYKKANSKTNSTS